MRKPVHSISATRHQVAVPEYGLTCKGNALKALRDRCGVTQGRLFKRQEMSFSTRSAQCTGSRILEIASAKVLATVGIY